MLGLIPFFIFLLYLFLVVLSMKDTQCCVQKAASSRIQKLVCSTIRKYIYCKYDFVGIAKQWCDCIYLCSIFSCQDPATYCQDRHTYTWENGERSEVQEDTNTHSLHSVGGWAHRNLELFKDGRRQVIFLFNISCSWQRRTRSSKKTPFPSLPQLIWLLKHLYTLE